MTEATTRRGFLGTAAAVGTIPVLGSTACVSTAVGGPGADPAALELPARNAILAIDTATRENYNTLRAEVIRQLGPVVVIENDHRGGRYTLIHHGERESLHPVSDIFELAKSIAHAPLGIYSIIAPYLSRRLPDLPSSARLDRHDVDMVAFRGPGRRDWVGPLQAFGATLTTARRQLANARMPRELQASCARILDNTIEFVDSSVRRGSFDMASFETCTGGLNDAIDTNIKHAAQAQIDGVEVLMRRWRDTVGPADWPGLYIVVLSIWTTSAQNQNSVIVKRFMDPAQAESHLIDLQTAQPPADPIHTALDNLARIVQDNVAAELIFPLNPQPADALKGREDLLTQEILHRPACPHDPRTAPRNA
jgi:hypothetical protein